MIVGLLAALATAGTIYFTAQYLESKRLFKTMTNIERANAQIEEERIVRSKLSILEKIQKYLKDRGYEGDWTPIILAITLLYLLSAVGLTIAGVSTWIGSVLALPAAIAIALAALGTVKRRRRKLFQVQLMQAFGLIATQIEGGDGAKRAIEKTVALVEDPLRSELTKSLNTLVGSASLVTALKDLETRYPSRPMSLFIAAVEIDDKVGTRLAPALRTAQTSLERDFELTAEANAEISQARGEFYAITAIIAFIAISLIGGAEGISKEVYTSLAGMIVIGVAAANYVFGIIRSFKIFRVAQGEL